MACGVTMSLKRSLDMIHISPHSSHRGIKRRRCMPPTVSRAVAPTKEHQINPSPFANVIPRLTEEQIARHVSAHLKRLQQRKHLFLSSSSTSCHSPPCHSPPCSPPSFSATCDSGVAAQCSATTMKTCDEHMTSVMTSMSSGSVHETSPPSDAAGRRKDLPLFSLKQVGMVCERMMKEREVELQEEYEKVLNSKLSEQYEAFLKFNQDQLHRRFGESAASYVS